jgi:hypothetical protein
MSAVWVENDPNGIGVDALDDKFGFNEFPNKLDDNFPTPPKGLAGILLVLLLLLLLRSCVPFIFCN